MAEIECICGRRYGLSYGKETWQCCFCGRHMELHVDEQTGEVHARERIPPGSKISKKQR